MSELTRYQIAKRELARKYMSDPYLAAERVARHYVAHSMVAKQTLELIRMQRYSETPCIYDELIRYQIECINNNHIEDFGQSLIP